MVQAILNDCKLTEARCTEVQGGDISRAYKVDAGDIKFFLKINDAHQYPGMFEKEAAGLQALKEESLLIIPAVIKFGVVGGTQYLLLQWIESGPIKNNSWENFGRGLASLHKKDQPYFGWKTDNYIGSLRQPNKMFGSWPLFYTECRIMGLIKQLFDAGNFTSADLSRAESLYKTIEELFPKEPPALLHGDLWSGNFMVNASGDISIYDPAVYFGHREMDLGMTKLFGGFDQRFYDAYNETYPLAPGWNQRLSLTQLYPVLVHAILFGGHYVEHARKIIGQYV